MHYYKRNIGDYAKKAGRLSMLEHGAYTLLIDACYDREQFPTLEEALDWAWARTEVELSAVKFVLSKFFTLIDGVYVQNRIKEELDEYKEKAEINTRIAQEREANRKKNKQSVNEPARTVNESCEKTHEPPPNHKPITNNHKPITNNHKPITNNQISISADALKNTEWFDSFWKQYPNKTAKQAAIKAWSRLKVTESLYQQIMISVSKQKSWQKWQEGYIPNPATWLNGKRWEDVEPMRVISGGGGDMAQYIRETSERLRKQDESLPCFDDSFLIEDLSHD